MSLPKANSTSILLFLTAVVTLRINKCIRISFHQYPIEFPMEAFLVGVFMPQIHDPDHLKYLAFKKLNKKQLRKGKTIKIIIKKHMLNCDKAEYI